MRFPLIVATFWRKSTLLWAAYIPSAINVHSDPIFSWTNTLYKSALFNRNNSGFQGKLRIAIAGNVWYYCLAKQSHKSDTRGNDVFFLSGKNAFSTLHSLECQRLCRDKRSSAFFVRSSFWAAHFLFVYC